MLTDEVVGCNLQNVMKHSTSGRQKSLYRGLTEQQQNLITKPPQNHHKPPLITSPPVATSRRQRQGISAIRARTSSIVILSHSSCRASFSSSIIDGLLRRRIRYLRTSQSPLIGLRSGDSAGCLRLSIQFASPSRFTAPTGPDFLP